MDSEGYIDVMIAQFNGRVCGRSFLPQHFKWSTVYFSFFERWMVVRNGSDGGVWCILWMLRGAVCGKKLSATKFVIFVDGEWWLKQILFKNVLMNLWPSLRQRFFAFCFSFFESEWWDILMMLGWLIRNISGGFLVWVLGGYV